MSPKKWFLGGVISLGTFLGLIDGSNAIFTLGGSLLSFAGASVCSWLWSNCSTGQRQR